MPFEISFTRQLAIADSDHYINDCCIGGDVVLNAILPDLQARYGPLAVVQEDWGWFIWFTLDGRELAIDVYCDDPRSGEFRIHLTSRIRRFLRKDIIDDTPDLDQLCQHVTAALADWAGQAPLVERLDQYFMAPP